MNPQTLIMQTQQSNTTNLHSYFMGYILPSLPPEVNLDSRQTKYIYFRKQPSYGLRQWEETLQFIVVSQWLSSYPEWSRSLIRIFTLCRHVPSRQQWIVYWGEWIALVAPVTFTTCLVLWQTHTKQTSTSCNIYQKGLPSFLVHISPYNFTDPAIKSFRNHDKIF